MFENEYCFKLNGQKVFCRRKIEEGYLLQDVYFDDDTSDEYLGELTVFSGELYKNIKCAYVESLKEIKDQIREEKNKLTKFLDVYSYTLECLTSHEADLNTQCIKTFQGILEGKFKYSIFITAEKWNGFVVKKDPIILASSLHLRLYLRQKKKNEYNWFLEITSDIPAAYNRTYSVYDAEKLTASKFFDAHPIYDTETFCLLFSSKHSCQTFINYLLLLDKEQIARHVAANYAYLKSIKEMGFEFPTILLEMAEEIKQKDKQKKLEELNQEIKKLESQ